MASNDSSAKADDEPFRFMDLVRELRDLVYDCLTTRVVPDVRPTRRQATRRANQYPKEEADVAVENAPSSPCLRVSKQFRHEYLESLRRNSATTLSIVDRNNYYPTAPILTSRTLLGHIHHIDIKLVAECEPDQTTHSPFCNCWQEVQENQELCMSELTPTIRTVGSCRLSLCVLGPASVEEEAGDKLERALSSTVGITGMTSVEVFHCPNVRPYDGNNVWQDYSLSSGPYASWTKDGGWIHHRIGAKDWELKTV